MTKAKERSTLQEVFATQHPDVAQVTVTTAKDPIDEAKELKKKMMARCHKKILESIATHVDILAMSSTTHDHYARRILAESVVSAEEDIGLAEIAKYTHIKISLLRDVKRLKKTGEGILPTTAGFATLPPQRASRIDKLDKNSEQVQVMYDYYRNSCIPSPCTDHVLNITEVKVVDGVKELTSVCHAQHFTTFAHMQEQYQDYEHWFKTTHQDPEMKIGITAFTAFFPRWVKKLKLEFCVCRYCDNLELLLSSLPAFVKESHCCLLAPNSKARKDDHDGEKLLADVPPTEMAPNSCSTMSCLTTKDSIRSVLLQNKKLSFNDIANRSLCDGARSVSGQGGTSQSRNCIQETAALRSLSKTRAYSVFNDKEVLRNSCGKALFLFIIISV